MSLQLPKKSQWEFIFWIVTIHRKKIALQCFFSVKLINTHNTFHEYDLHNPTAVEFIYNNSQGWVAGNMEN